MATSWREPNMARWVGIRPGHGGVQVSGASSKANGYETLYTVGAGKILLIFSWYLSSASSAAGGSSFYIRDGAAAEVHRLCRHGFLAAGVLSNSGERFIPYEVPAGYTLDLYTSAATISAYGGFDGILIDA